MLFCITLQTMAQTRFVLQKALQQNLSLVVAINKIDRPDARIKEVIDEVLYLLMDLGYSFAGSKQQ